MHTVFCFNSFRKLSIRVIGEGILQFFNPSIINFFVGKLFNEKLISLKLSLILNCFVIQLIFNISCKVPIALFAGLQ